MHTQIQCVLRTQKPTEGTGFKNPTTLGENQMAKVTYRGVVYDTDTKKATAKKKVDLTYRGIAHSSK